MRPDPLLWLVLASSALFIFLSWLALALLALVVEGAG